jgi:hypothetical protein
VSRYYLWGLIVFSSFWGGFTSEFIVDVLRDGLCR